MGQLDALKPYQPENITPVGAVRNDLSDYEQRMSRVYMTPAEAYGNAWKMGPFTPAGISETEQREFLQDRWHWPATNVQIVTVPERPVDEGTFNAFIGNSGYSGVYLQGNVTGTTKQVAGQAPTTGVYTGLGNFNTEYEGGQ